jgi:hypothetical protein
MAKINYDKFQKSLMRLEEQYKEYLLHHDQLEDYLEDALKESCIQRFEVCLDTAWKHLHKHYFSYDYSGEKADSAFEVIEEFIKAAINVYERMTKEKWLK